MNAVVAPRYAMRIPQQYKIRWAGGFSGLGQGCISPCIDDPTICCDDPGTTVLASTPTATASSGGGTPVSNAPFNAGSIISNAVNTAGKVATVAVAPAGSTISPAGAVTIGGLTLSNSTLVPVLLGAGVLVLIIAMASKK